MADPVALTDAKGIVHAYACGVCSNVHVHHSTRVETPGWNAGSSRKSARDCCMCARCGEGVVPRGDEAALSPRRDAAGIFWMGSYCDPCFVIVKQLIVGLNAAQLEAENEISEMPDPVDEIIDVTRATCPRCESEPGDGTECALCAPARRMATYLGRDK